MRINAVHASLLPYLSVSITQCMYRGTKSSYPWNTLISAHSMNQPGKQRKIIHNVHWRVINCDSHNPVSSLFSFFTLFWTTWNPRVKYLRRRRQCNRVMYLEAQIFPFPFPFRPFSIDGNTPLSHSICSSFFPFLSIWMYSHPQLKCHFHTLYRLPLFNIFLRTSCLSHSSFLS